MSFYTFFINDKATTQIYTLSLHDALPIFDGLADEPVVVFRDEAVHVALEQHPRDGIERVVRLAELDRSEEHTSELQSRRDLVCRLLLEKKKNIIIFYIIKYILKCRI